MTDVVLTEIDLDIENRLANHEFAIEWVKMQDERIKELEAALRPFAVIGADKKHKDLGDLWCINVPIPDLRRAALALKSD